MITSEWKVLHTTFFYAALSVVMHATYRSRTIVAMIKSRVTIRFVALYLPFPLIFSYNFLLLLYRCLVSTAESKPPAYGAIIRWIARWICMLTVMRTIVLTVLLFLLLVWSHTVRTVVLNGTLLGRYLVHLCVSCTY